jgi:DNA-binding CsgD family transcriptional regulator
VLLEREKDLASMAAALRAAAEGHGAMAVIRGPLGVGKSALLEAISELGALRDTLTLRAHAAATERDFPFGVVRQLIEPALSRLSETQAARWCAGTTFGSGLVPYEEPLAVHPSPQSAERLEAALAALAALVDNMSGDGTVLILIDDLQWADAESLRMLCRVARRLRGRRILLVCTLLTGDARSEQPLVQELLSLAEHTPAPSNLGYASTRSLVEEYYGTPADEEFVRVCHDRSGGNPLFLRSIVTEAQFHGLKPCVRDSAAAVTLRPQSLRRRFMVFLDSMPVHVRRAAFAMTALDGNTDRHLLGCLSELDAARQADSLLVLKKSGVIADPLQPVFAQSVVRDAVEDCMQLAERAAMRVAAAKLLHRSGHPVEQVAERLMTVVTPQDRGAVHILRMAAGSALRRGSPRDAARYLRRALLDCSLTGPDRSRLLIDLATAERSFSTAASMRHVLEAVPLLDTVQERAAVVTDLSPVLMDPASLQVGEILRRVSADLAKSDPPSTADRELKLRLEARERLFSCATNPVNVQLALRRLKALGPQPPMNTLGERELLTVLLHIATVANAAPAEELASLSMRLLHHDPPSHAHVHTTLPLVVHVLTAADKADSAVRWLTEAYRVAESRRGNVEQAVIRTEQALVAIGQGNLADAKVKVRQSSVLADPALDGPPAACVAVLAIVALNTGEPKLAERVLSKARLESENRYLTALGSMARGAVAAGMGRTQTGLDHFLAAGRMMDQMGWRNPVILPWASYAALMHHRLGDTARAVELCHKQVEDARAWGAPNGVGKALTVLGRVTSGHRGVELLKEAIDVLEKSGNRYTLCMALYALGRRLEPNRAQSRAVLVRALQLSIECNSSWLTEKIRSLLSEKTTSQVSGREELTPSEYRVTQLATAGLTNQEISGQLEISCRAVEKHLTRCYRKLGIRGRLDLAAALSNTRAEESA